MDQNIVWQGEHDAFGQTHTTVAQVANPLCFPGQYFDAETGLHYNWHRYYNPNTGRYISSDPIGLAGGLNTFGYVGQNPLAYFDSDGLYGEGYGVLREYQAGAASAWAEFVKLWLELSTQVGLGVATDGASVVATRGLLSCRVPGTLGSNFGNLATNLTKNAEKLRNGGKNTTVDVKTKLEADRLLNEAFPGYQKVNGVGPQDAAGIRRKRKMDRFKQGGTYHKDYAIDSSTGRVRGHGPNDAHGAHPHINIKRTDGTKVIINITGN